MAGRFGKIQEPQYLRLHSILIRPSELRGEVTRETTDDGSGQLIDAKLSYAVRGQLQ